MLAPRMSSVNVKGLRQTEESYSVLFTPVATLPISMKISSGTYTKCVPWSEIPGPNITFRSVFDLGMHVNGIGGQFFPMIHVLKSGLL